MEGRKEEGGGREGGRKNERREGKMIKRISGSKARVICK